MRVEVAAQPTMTDALLFTGAQRMVTCPVPLVALGPHDLLVHTSLAALSPTHAWLRITGALAHLPGMAFPLIPGDAAVGMVVATGAAVDAAWRGVPVFVGAAHTPDGVSAARGVQQAWLVAPADAVVRIETMEPERALLISPVGTALHNLERAGMVAGARVAILGQGVLGQIVARVVRLRGAAHVTVADASTHRRVRAVADQAVLLPSLPPPGLSDGAGDIDLLVDTMGDVALIRSWSARVRSGGTLLLLGWYPRLDLAYLQERPSDVRVVLAAEPESAAYAVAVELLAADGLDTTGLTTHRFGIDRAAQAYAVALGDPDALQVVVAWQ